MKGTFSRFKQVFSQNKQVGDSVYNSILNVVPEFFLTF